MKAKVGKLAASLVEDLHSLAFRSHTPESDVENNRENSMMLQGEPKPILLH
ncbi:hypothetical protein [Legionella parisiensis]|uniref:Uncharacterized protein n=1 Tax=Legionella parisiensis TaxID=45071 RepID=A0A1E5JXY4_9GAMM|nr:hypothetical protein [Legionella parisiensis]KTD42247.1 hypothetical protein Lpar_3564 [Legionella parisiensis]OEH48918.1 hypothetical protein lpari_00063 [Legionella parisiensis]STX72314.1 Uncharacterised protein [Legionella parisiensis]